MALLWIDHFGDYGTSAAAPAPAGIVLRRYTSADETRLYAQAGAAASLQCGANAADYFRTAVITTDDTLIVGFTNTISLSGVDTVIAALYDGTTMGVNLLRTGAAGSGQISVRRGTTVLGTTTTLTLSHNTFYTWQLKVKCNATTGTYELRLDNAVVLSGTGANTKAGSNDYHDRVSFENALNQYSRVAHLYINDGSGARNNDFLGRWSTESIKPSAAGNSTGWTPSTGSNYQNVDETPTCDDDTTYNSSSANDTMDLFTYGNLTGTNTVAGVQLNTDCRNEATSTNKIKPMTRRSSTDYVGVAQSVGSTAFVTLRQIEETDPSTSAPWTAAGVNAAEFGVKLEVT